MPVGDYVIGDRRAVQIVLDTLGDRRLRDGAEPIATTRRCGSAFEVTLTWLSELPVSILAISSVYVVTRDGTVAQIEP